MKKEELKKMLEYGAGGSQDIYIIRGRSLIENMSLKIFAELKQ